MAQNWAGTRRTLKRRKLQQKSGINLQRIKSPCLTKFLVAGELLFKWHYITGKCLSRRLNAILNWFHSLTIDIYFQSQSISHITHHTISFVSAASPCFSFNSTWQLFIYARAKQQQGESLSNTSGRLADVKHATPATESMSELLCNIQMMVTTVVIVTCVHNV